MMQEAPVILVMIGLLKRIADSMVKVGVVFCTSFRWEYFQLIKNPPSQSPGLPMSDWSLLSAGLCRVHD
jgi:hypothetical protein